MEIRNIRDPACYFLYTIYGLFKPALNTTKAIVTNDVESQKEYLTYWTVIIISMLIEMIFETFGLYRTTPPEIRIVFIFWLTRKEFQGAYKIYTVFLKESYELFEKDIDDHVNAFSAKFWYYALRHGQNIFWQLTFSPTDGIVTGIFQFLPLQCLNLQNSTSVDLLQKPVENTKQSGLHKTNMLNDFIDMMQEGIIIRAGSEPNYLELCHCSLLSNPNFLCIEDFSRLNDVTYETAIARYSEAKNFSPQNTSNDFLSELENTPISEIGTCGNILLFRSITRIQNISTDARDPSLIVMEFLSERAQMESIYRERNGAIMYMKVSDDIDSSEALLFGLNFACLQSKKLALRAFTKISDSVNRKLLKSAWKCLSKPN